MTDRAWRHWPADHARPRLESISAPCSQRSAIAGIPYPPCRVARLAECSGNESECAPLAWTMGQKVPAAAGRSACRPFQGLDCDGLGSGPLFLSVRPPAQKMGASAGTWRPSDAAADPRSLMGRPAWQNQGSAPQVRSTADRCTSPGRPCRLEFRITQGERGVCRRAVSMTSSPQGRRRSWVSSPGKRVGIEARPGFSPDAA